MNKIVIDKENVILEKITKSIDVNFELRESEFGISKIFIKVLKNSNLFFDVNIDNSKYYIEIEVDNNVTLNIYEMKKGNKAKIQYNYILLNNSIINLYKYNGTTSIKEMLLVNLNEEYSKFNYNFKSISKSKENYDLVINHNSKNTDSFIKNNIVNVEDGKTTIQVSSYVDNGNIGCNVDQSNRIINLTDNKCEIRPNLYIDEYDCNANHSALIGGFSKQELFYLQSRGLSINDANRLLINGFLLSDFDNVKMIKEIKNNINEYWG